MDIFSHEENNEILKWLNSTKKDLQVVPTFLFKSENKRMNTLGDTPLHILFSSLHPIPCVPQKTKVLVEICGNSINVENILGITPFHRACEMLPYLGFTCFGEGTDVVAYEILSLMIHKYHADVNKADNRKEHSLHYLGRFAVHWNSFSTSDFRLGVKKDDLIKLVILLLENGANPNQVNNQGNTFLLCFLAEVSQFLKYNINFGILKTYTIDLCYGEQGQPPNIHLLECLCLEYPRPLEVLHGEELPNVCEVISTKILSNEKNKITRLYFRNQMKNEHVCTLVKGLKHVHNKVKELGLLGYIVIEPTTFNLICEVLQHENCKLEELELNFPKFSDDYVIPLEQIISTRIRRLHFKGYFLSVAGINSIARVIHKLQSLSIVIDETLNIKPLTDNLISFEDNCLKDFALLNKISSSNLQELATFLTHKSCKLKTISIDSLDESAIIDTLPIFLKSWRNSGLMEVKILNRHQPIKLIDKMNSFIMSQWCRKITLLCFFNMFKRNQHQGNPFSLLSMDQIRMIAQSLDSWYACRDD